MASQDFPAPTEGSCSPTSWSPKTSRARVTSTPADSAGEVVTPAPYEGRHSDRSSAATSRPPTSNDWLARTGITDVTQILDQTLSGGAEEALRSAHAVARDTAKLKQFGSTNVRK